MASHTLHGTCQSSRMEQENAAYRTGQRLHSFRSDKAMQGRIRAINDIKGWRFSYTFSR